MELLTIAPTPTATWSTCVYAPAALPSTVTSAARRPCDTARLTTNITLGPGMMMIANATAANPTSDEVGGTLVLKPLQRPNRRAISTAEGHVQFRSQRAVLPPDRSSWRRNPNRSPSSTMPRPHAPDARRARTGEQSSRWNRTLRCPPVEKTRWTSSPRGLVAIAQPRSDPPRPDERLAV